MTVDALSETIGHNIMPTIRPLQALLLYYPVVCVTHKSFREYVQNSKKCESRFLAKEPQSITATMPERPNLYTGFPLRRLATIQAYPGVERAATDVGVQIDPDSISSQPVARGAYGDIYRARYTDGLEVAIKSLRIYNGSDASHEHQAEKDTVRELLIWSRLDHPNVLSLLGICVLNGEIAMVSEWMPNDNVREYSRKNPSVNKLGLIADIVAGLKYLHEEHIAHGDLKGENVVVSAARKCILVDFGLAKLCEESLGISSRSANGTMRWLAPELMDIDSNTRTSITGASDIYALGMTALEILTGKFPFSEYERDVCVVKAVGVEHKIPERPSPEAAPELSDTLWELLNSCWSHRYMERPSAVELEGEISELINVANSA
ncbi:hypothetical protein FRC12_011836 [Ceratobasidium sp. 428]|nr:hypothetical protein FRC12_011836 [Ceratobasidium sp. 428]